MLASVLVPTPWILSMRLSQAEMQSLSFADRARLMASSSAALAAEKLSFRTWNAARWSSVC